MAIDDPEHLLNKIGQLLTADGEYPFEPTLPHAQLDHNMTGESIQGTRQSVSLSVAGERTLDLRTSRAVGSAGKQ